MRFATVLTALLALVAPVGAVEVGDMAPGFEAESTMGKISLADYAGRKNVVLAFYYKDFTGG